MPPMARALVDGWLRTLGPDSLLRSDVESGSPQRESLHVSHLPERVDVRIGSEGCEEGIRIHDTQERCASEYIALTRAPIHGRDPRWLVAFQSIKYRVHVLDVAAQIEKLQ